MHGENNLKNYLLTILLPLEGDGSKQGIIVSALEAFCLMIFECFVVVRQKEESPVGR